MFRSDGAGKRFQIGRLRWAHRVERREPSRGSRPTHAEAEEKARFAVPCPQLAAEAVAAQVRSGVKRLAISAARAKDGEIGSLIPMFFFSCEDCRLLCVLNLRVLVLSLVERLSGWAAICDPSFCCVV